MTFMPVAIVLGLWAALFAGSASPRMMEDGAGRRVEVPDDPRRIVSLAPSVTEILFALSAGDRVVGVTDFCDYPSEVTTRARIGGLINPDLERIVSLKPDLAISSTSGNYLEDTERLERLGVPVYAIHTPDVEGMLRTLVRVGEIVGHGAEADALARSLRERLARLERRAGSSPRPRVLFVIEPEPLIAAGRNTFIGDALRRAGAEAASLGASGGWTQYDMEQVLSLAPDVILTTEVNRSWASSVGRRPEWRHVPAARTGHVYVVSDSIQHPGPRLVDGIEEVAEILRKVAGVGDGGGEESGSLEGEPGPTAVPPPPCHQNASGPGGPPAFGGSSPL